MIKYCICFVVFMMGMTLQSQSILGKWRTVDDETGEEKSVVEIYERNGKVFGKIIEIFDPKKRDLPCIYCEGDDYNQPVLGMNIIKNMKKDVSAYKEGTITDPQDGKTYSCRLKLDGKDTLQVRGYLSVFYSTQYWKRVTE